MSLESPVRAALEAQNPWWTPGLAWARSAHRQRRDLFERLRRDLLDPELRRATLLLGPRQVGKSTLLRQIAESVLDEGWPPGNLLYFDFDDPRVRGLGAEVGTVERHAPASADPHRARILLLDELHLAPEWASSIKAAVDRDRLGGRTSLRILATSSAASLLHAGAVASGQGRWNEVQIFGLSFAEHLRFQGAPGEAVADVLLRSPEQLERYLAKGGMPEHVHAEPSEELRATLRRDLVEFAIRQDLAVPLHEDPERLDFERIKRLFVYLAQDSGSILTIAERARELGARSTTVIGWLQLLVDACLLHRVEPHVPATRESALLPKASSRLATKPKIYVSDHGLIPAFTLSAFPMAQEAVRSRVIEAVVLRHLLPLVSSREDIRYFRRRDGLEVDFVFWRNGRLHAIEATSSMEVDSRKAKRFEDALEAIAADHGTFIYRGATAARSGPVSLLPLHSFLLDPNAVTGGDS